MDKWADPGSEVTQETLVPGLIADLKALRRRRGGLHAANLTTCRTLLALCRGGESGRGNVNDADLALQARDLLVTCINRQGNSETGVVARAMFPVDTRLRGLTLTERRREAASQLDKSEETIRSYEDRVLQEVAMDLIESRQTLRPTSSGDTGVDPQERPAVVDGVVIRPAAGGDRTFVVDLMLSALEPFYGGDHRAHAERILGAHLGGGVDHVGHFSREQQMFVAEIDGEPVGMVHLVGKRQSTYKISPLIVADAFRKRRGVGASLLEYAETHARANQARMIYCTVAERNTGALTFFEHHGYIRAGNSASHYKAGMTELMLYKLFSDPDNEEKFDRPNISVIPAQPQHEGQIRALLSATLPRWFTGIDDAWMEALFAGYRRRASGDVNSKYKLIYVAVDRSDTVLGVVGATPKKGEPIKLMPFVASSLPAFVALLTDLPYQLVQYGRKLYTHLDPGVDEVIALQQRGWKLDGALPAAYHSEVITLQWSLQISTSGTIRNMRVKERFLNLILEGRKTLEVRVGYDTIRAIRAGELIRLSSRTHEAVISVRAVREYPTFESMLASEEAERIVPGSDAATTLGVLREIYPPAKERLGVIVLEIDASGAAVQRAH